MTSLLVEDWLMCLVVGSLALPQIDGPIFSLVVIRLLSQYCFYI